MKKLLIKLIFLLLGYLTLYLFTIFINFEFKVLEWTPDQRGMFVIFGGIMGACYIGLNEISSIGKPKEVLKQSDLKILYEESLERKEHLRSLPQTLATIAKLTELQLFIVRIQFMLLKNLKK